MNTTDLEMLWKSQEEPGRNPSSMSMEEIRQATMQFSSENISASQRLVIFDMLYKIAVLAGYAVLLFLGETGIGKLIFTATAMLCLVYLVVRNRSLGKRLQSINEAEPVLTVLQKRYDALLVFYPEFFFNSAITNPLFVFAGFQFYHFFRYGEDRFHALLTDPVTYIFLFLAFIIPYIAQKVNYGWVIGEMENILDLEINELEQELRVIKIQAAKRRRRVIFSIITLLGLGLLLTILFLTL